MCKVSLEHVNAVLQLTATPRGCAWLFETRLTSVYSFAGDNTGTVWALRPEVLSQSTTFTDSAVRFLRGPLGMAVRLRCDAPSLFISYPSMRARKFYVDVSHA